MYCHFFKLIYTNISMCLCGTKNLLWGLVNKLSISSVCVCAMFMFVHLTQRTCTKNGFVFQAKTQFDDFGRHFNRDCQHPG